MKFSELNLEDSVLDALDAMNFQECTPVQEHTIPVILEGKDLIGVAQTGTGKTAAYLLPVLNQLSKGGYPEDAINCIIMSPTRELFRTYDLANVTLSPLNTIKGFMNQRLSDGPLAIISAFTSSARPL